MIIKIVKPFVYGLYMWLRHFICQIDIEKQYFWKLINGSYVTFWHPAIVITKGFDNMTREMIEIELKLEQFIEKT